MTEPQVTMSGPARLRALSRELREALPGPSETCDELEQMAALWEADLERAANDLMLSEESFIQMRAKRDDILRELQTTRAALASKTMALQEAEESVDRLQSSKAALQAEIKGLYSAGPTLSEWAELTQARSTAEAALEQVQSALSVRDHQYKAAQAALERARALVARWKAEANPSEPALSASVVFLAHSMADELAAVLGS